MTATSKALLTAIVKSNGKTRSEKKKSSSS